MIPDSDVWQEFNGLMQFEKQHQRILWQLLKWRRDVRHFRSDPIPQTMLERLRGTLDLAPSVGNSRPWRFIRVQDPRLRRQIKDDFIACHKKAGMMYNNEARRAAYFELKLAGLDQAPEQFAVFTELNVTAGYGLGRQTMPDTLKQSTAMAIFSFWLAARSENLGLGMVSILEPTTLCRLLDVPQSWSFSAYLCLGFAERTDDTPLLHRANWQHNEATTWIEK